MLRYMDIGNGEIMDIVKLLIWKKSDDNIRRTWEEAIDYAASLGDGWRLPTVEELFCLADRARLNPAINPIFQCRSYHYWSSSVFSLYPEYAWYVDFGGGDSNWEHKSNHKYYVRCIR